MTDMKIKQQPVSARGMIILFLVLLNVIILKTGYTTDENWYWALTVSTPLLVVAGLSVPFFSWAIMPKWKNK